MTIDPKLLDEILKECKSPEDIVGESGALKQIQKALLERALEAELTHELGYSKNERTREKSGNSRNGKTSKTVKTENGELNIDVPRDRNSDFEPQIIKKRQTRFKGFDDKIIALYARGLSVSDIQSNLKEIYDVNVSPTLISNVTDAIIDEVHEWQNRILDQVYPIVYFDALFIKMREDGKISNQAVYLVLGVNLEGRKELLGIWIAKTEGAKFWLSVLTELNNRGLKDILIACVDGLSGFEDAIKSVYPHTEVQLCIVHMIRNSLKYVSWKDRKELVKDLKAVYQASTESEGKQSLELFSQKWDKKYPMISKSWINNWESLSVFFAYSEDIRKAIYTTNAIESLNMTLRKVLKNKRSFPNEESAMKLLYLAIRNVSKKWSMPIREWGKALNQLAIRFEGRISIF